MATIGIMDSGVGGLSVFREICKRLPDESYVYYSDAANCPYGDKSQEFILERCRSITDMFISRGVDAVVIACNTATAAAIASLRSEYPIPFIGMEPAVKPAAIGTSSGIIGVLATAGTLKGSKYLCTKSRFEDDVTILEHVGSGFVELVESGLTQGPQAEEVVEKSLRPLLDAGADTIVLGCTHYPFLLPVLRKVAGDGIRFIDPAPAVAKHLEDVLREKGIALGEASPSREYLCSGDSSVLDKMKW